MFIDASAIIAILNREPGSEELVKRLAASRSQAYSSPLAHFEAVIGLARSRSGRHRSPTATQVEAARKAVDAFLTEVRAETMAISDDIGLAAIKAAQTYGKAVGHEADLNFGDCFAYACAKARRMALLYKGNDFLKTDLA
ncbi:type II toxin-antitoxin system VapC family toxin [Acuticoccus sediminis]|uniref:type II toxin-antitoxin system VapC family toxin n=1 Tax=Acuticoccus sediminis TaxID=2184697 RepID=UPI001CFF53F1|nr:type II toxin-antitoxin system VapC family toxin [Acuticoccus sediminis]